MKKAKREEAARIADTLFSDQLPELYSTKSLAWEDCLEIGRFLEERGFAMKTGNEHHVRWKVRGAKKTESQSFHSDKAFDQFLESFSSHPDFILVNHASRSYGEITHHQ